MAYNYNNALPQEFESLMPDGLDMLGKFNWREQKIKELIVNGVITVDVNGNYIFPSNIPVNESKSIETNVEIKDETKNRFIPKNNSKPIKQQKKKRISDTDNDEIIEHVRIPSTVMDALRRSFPTSASKTDLISAAVYILTNGDCEISDKALKIVDAYTKGDKLVSMEETLKRIEASNRRQIEMLNSIELCTCFNTFDRRFGSKEPRTTPGMTEFRETGTLDMLARLREQAMDQLQSDRQDRGRQIYSQIKGKKD